MHAQIKKAFNNFIANHSILFFIWIMIIIVIIWTIGFHFIEWRDFFNAFYFTTVTMSTIGYGDMAPLTHSGKLMAIVYGFMWAPIFIWLTGLFFQSRFQNLVKTSIHNYHKEIKEAEKLSNELKNELVQEENVIAQTTKPSKKKWRKFW